MVVSLEIRPLEALYTSPPPYTKNLLFRAAIEKVSYRSFVSVVAGDGMLMHTTFAPPFLSYQSKDIYGGGYKAVRGLISRDIAGILIRKIN